MASMVCRISSITERLSLDDLFASRQPLEVELGSGDGSFLAQYAALHPQHNFIGVERLLGRLRKLDRKAQRAGLKNLRLIRLEASYALEYLLPQGSIRALHVYFPDPWPKRRHHKNRLINKHFTEVAYRALESGGVIYLRTDDCDYFGQIVEVFGETKEYRAVETPAQLSEIKTDFECEFHKRGIATRLAAYQRD